MTTNRLNGVDEGTNGLLLCTIPSVDSIDDLDMLKERPRNESALEYPLESMP